MSARIFCIVTLISIPALLGGQSSSISGPVTGYVFDNATRGLRPILGIPGAALVGDPLDFGLAVASASVAPRQDAAFVTAADGSLHLFRIQAGVPTDLNFNGLVNQPQRVVFSPAGTAAALYAPGSIQLVNGLPDSPALAASPNLQAAGIPDALALSDDGAALLLASGSTIELFAGAADLGKLTDSAGPALVAFAPGGHDAAIVDRTGAGVVLFHNLTGTVNSQILAASDDTIQASSAAAFTADGQQLLLANGTGQLVTTVSVATGTRGTIPCTCTPSTLARMGDLFRLNDLSQDPLWLLDSRAGGTGVTFVPAPVESAATTVRRPKGPTAPSRGLKPLGDLGGPAARSQANLPE